MNIYEYAAMESKIESAENRIRSIHNDLESQKLFSKKNFLPYENRKFIDMVCLIKKDIDENNQVK